MTLGEKIWWLLILYTTFIRIKYLWFKGEFRP
ncbi:unnamed protein product, partial [marine sediment metagenome]